MTVEDTLFSILADRNLLAHQIIYKVAKHYPDILIKVVESATWEDEVLNMLASGRKIDAIKYYRDIHGSSIDEARRPVENLDEMDKYNAQNILSRKSRLRGRN